MGLAGILPLRSSNGRSAGLAKLGRLLSIVGLEGRFKITTHGLEQTSGKPDFVLFGFEERGS